MEAKILLAELKKVAINLEDFINPSGQFDFTETAGREMVRDIRIAIANAKGQA